MNPERLLSVQADVNASRKRFLDALQESHTEDGELIIKDFLLPFLAAESNRSELARQFAREAIAAIRTFLSDRAQITQSLAIAHLSLGTVLNGLLSDAIRRIFDGINRAGPAGGLAALQTAQAEACERALQAGTRIHEVQTLATGVLELRTVTLRAFRAEHLHLSVRDIVARMRQQGAEEAKDQLHDEAWEVAKEAAEELLAIVLDEEPVTRVRKVLERFTAIIAGKEPDTSPGGTDEMLKLLGQLRKENDVLRHLEETFVATFTALEVLAAPK